jgi:hypothetical protein
MATYRVPGLQLCDRDAIGLCHGTASIGGLYCIDLACVLDAQLATGGEFTAVSSKVIVGE